MGGPCASGFDSSNVEARSLSGRLRCSWSLAWPCRLGCDWTPIPLLRHLATRDQYRDYDRHVSDGFVIETTQNRALKQIQLKLHELMRAATGVRTGLARLEELTEEELASRTGDFERLRARMAAAGQGPNNSCSIPDPPSRNPTGQC